MYFNFSKIVFDIVNFLLSASSIQCILGETTKPSVRKREQLHPTMRIEVDQGNNCIKYCPNDGTQSGTIILMHGLGDSADGLDVSIFDLFLLTRQK